MKLRNDWRWQVGWRAVVGVALIVLGAVMIHHATGLWL